MLQSLKRSGFFLTQKAVKIADALRGKDQPTYTPHLDAGANVVIINAEKVILTGSKDQKKVYKTYSDHMGGLKVTTAAEIRAKKPEHMIELAVQGMLPKNRLGRQLYRKLHVYAGSAHPHAAQQPISVN
jgi:large subunit ribosomal protein L13